MNVVSFVSGGFLAGHPVVRAGGGKVDMGLPGPF